MTEVECIERIKDLADLKRIYANLYYDKFSTFFKDASVKSMMIKTEGESLRLKELLNNLELEDSYDQNTGWRPGEKLQ